MMGGLGRQGRSTAESMRCDRSGGGLVSEDRRPIKEG